MKRNPACRQLVFALLALALMLAGCSAAGFEFPRLVLPATPTPVVTDAVFPPPTPHIVQPTLPPPNLADAHRLIVWLPPALDPAADTAAGKLLKSQLDAFAAENPGLEVVVRVKAPGGPGGLLASLSSASAAAPGALPSLVALTRSDLEVAALKGLVQPMDGLTDFAQDNDWFPYARNLAQIQGSIFGLPYGGDALLLLYRPVRLGPPPASWDAVFQLGQPLAFPAADPQEFFTLLLYQGLGGAVEDEQRRPMLQQDVLVKALTLYSDGAQQGVFPFWLSTLQNDQQAWQAYRDQRAQWLVTWSSAYFEETPVDSAITALPAPGNEAFTLATGWVWALAEPRPEQRALAVKLADRLVESGFLAKWGAAADLLPVRPSGLAGWHDESLRSVLSQVAQAAHVRPSNDLMVSLSPALEIATLQVIKRENDPTQAAQAAAQHLAIPGVK